MHIHEILAKIRSFQSQGGQLYAPGLFPSQRVHRYVPYFREDNNIFFSTLIAFTLQNILVDLSSEGQKTAGEIVEKVRLNQKDYQHWKGEGSFNFWPSNPSQHFPQGWWLRRFRNFAIPDDADDSCLIHLTNEFSRDQNLWLLNKLETHYGQDQVISPLTPDGYKDLRAYPTFFGKKMLREMDACVISNVLYFILYFDLPWSAMAADSVQFLQRVLLRDDYLKIPFFVAPNYGIPAVILYHISRVVTRFPTHRFQELRPQLIKTLKNYQMEHGSFMEELLINTSLTWLRLPAKPLEIPEDIATQFSNFYFFQAGMLTAFQKPWLNKYARHPFFHLKYRCEAYYWTLLLENKVAFSRYSRS